MAHTSGEPRIEAPPTRLVLASASPRRQELLARLDCPFECIPAHVDETIARDWTPREAVERLAVRKASCVHEDPAVATGAGRVVLGADTLVVVGDPDDSAARILGKPRDVAEARAMLGELSNRPHIVLTALALIRPGVEAETAVDVTEVTFRALDAAQIDAYVCTGEPLDKAGAYGIQGAARSFVAGIEGCFFNVVGFPLGRAAALLGELCGPAAEPCDCATHPLQRGAADCSASVRRRR